MARPRKYSDEVRNAAVSRLLATGAPSMLTLSRELQISEPTLAKWKREALAAKRAKANAQSEVEWKETVSSRSNSGELERLKKELQEAKDMNRLAMALLKQNKLI